MNLFELYEPTPDAYRSEKEDNTARKSDENRKRSARLTLAKLNQLRMMNDSRKIDQEKKIETLHTQYKPPAPDAGGGLP
jgi:hypothetical protein